MPWFRPRDLLDQTFEVGIILKGLDGLLEVIGGLLLFVVSPATIDRVVTSLTQHELSEDPHDLLATHLLRTAHGLTGPAVVFGAVYLLAHGLVKVILVTALLKNQLWAYPWTIGFLGVFIVYQLYRLSFHAAPVLGLIGADALTGIGSYGMNGRRCEVGRTRRSACNAADGVGALLVGNARCRVAAALPAVSSGGPANPRCGC
jgi:uncharacterized membrane protein